MRLTSLLLLALLPVAAAFAQDVVESPAAAPAAASMDAPAGAPSPAAVEAPAATPATTTETDNTPGVLAKQPAAPESTPSSTAAAPARSASRLRQVFIPGNLPLFSSSRYSGEIPPASRIDAADDGTRGGLITKGPRVAAAPESERISGLEFTTGIVQPTLDVAIGGLDAWRNGRVVGAVDQDIKLQPSLSIGAIVRQQIREHLDILARGEFIDVSGGDVESVDTFTNGSVAATPYDIDSARLVTVAVGGRWRQPLRGCFTAEASAELRQVSFSSRMSYVDAFGTPVGLSVSGRGAGAGLDVAAACRIDPYLSLVLNLGVVASGDIRSRDAGLSMRWHLR